MAHSSAECLCLGHAERRAYLDKYNEAKNNYEPLKFSAASLGVSLRERAKSLGWTQVIEDMGFDLDVPVFD